MAIIFASLSFSYWVPQDEITPRRQYCPHGQNSFDPLSSKLGLTSRGGERLGASVEVTASDAGGGESVTAQARFDARGWYEAYTPESIVAIAQFIDRLSRVIVVDRGPIGPAPGPVERFDPVPVRHFADRIRTERVVLHPRAQMEVEQLTRFGMLGDQPPAFEQC